MRLPSRLVLLGSPVVHSLSPRFQSAALESAGLPIRYEAIDVAPHDLDIRLRELVREGAAGNVTIPHKRAVLERCAHATPLARRAGAVNTFWVEDGALAGDNTDVPAFTAAATELLGGTPRGIAIALVGAGGAAAAVAVAAADWTGATVSVFARDAARSEAFARRFAPNVTAATSLDAALDGAMLVVNATPLGLGDGDPLPVPIERLPRGAAVFDLVYRRGGTPWMRAARAAGLSAADGLGMLVEQGALAFERWFGRAPDREAMWRAVR